MSETSIKVENLSKRYRIGTEQEIHETFAGMAVAWIVKPIQNYRRIKQLTKFNPRAAEDNDDVIWALQDVSFEIKRGEVVGIIGRNGAGKSTLLKVLSKITHPTSGRVEMYGRISSLLEVGTGFHSELTGRENVYLNGTILGMSKSEVDEKYEEIVEFSGVRKFIDTPVKFYSSGMRVRLAFSVAAHLEPEILLIDEVLAVGDAEFQNKCLGKMEDVARVGRTVLFVSHNMSAMSRLCERGIWLEEGKIFDQGPINQVIQSYLFSGISESNPRVDFELLEDKAAQIISVEALDFQEEPSLTHLNINPFFVKIRYRINQTLTKYRLGIIIRTPDGFEILTRTTSDFDNSLWSDEEGNYAFKVKIPDNLLKPGQYLITVFLGQPGIKQHDKAENILAIRLDGNTKLGQGLIVTPLDWEKVVEN